MRVAKTKALISFAVTAKLICVFVFAYADCWFSHVMAHMYVVVVYYDLFEMVPMSIHPTATLLYRNKENCFTTKRKRPTYLFSDLKQLLIKAA